MATPKVNSAWQAYLDTMNQSPPKAGSGFGYPDKKGVYPVILNIEFTTKKNDPSRVTAKLSAKITDLTDAHKKALGNKSVYPTTEIPSAGTTLSFVSTGLSGVLTKDFSVFSAGTPNLIKFFQWFQASCKNFSQVSAYLASKIGSPDVLAEPDSDKAEKFLKDIEAAMKSLGFADGFPAFINAARIQPADAGYSFPSLDYRPVAPSEAAKVESPWSDWSSVEQQLIASAGSKSEFGTLTEDDGLDEVLAEGADGDENPFEEQPKPEPKPEPKPKPEPEPEPENEVIAEAGDDEDSELVFEDDDL